MGFNDKELVCLSGAHALGRCHLTASGYVGPWSFTPLVFDNTYFKLLVDVPWTPNPTSPKFQYQGGDALLS
jgi:cytochrome c peroxidase